MPASGLEPEVISTPGGIRYALFLPMALWLGAWGCGRLLRTTDPYAAAVLILLLWSLVAALALLSRLRPLGPLPVHMMFLMILMVIFMAQFATNSEGRGALLWQVSLMLLPVLTAAWVMQEGIPRPVILSAGMSVCVGTLIVTCIGQACTAGIRFRQQDWWGIGNINSCQALFLPWILAGCFGCIGRRRQISLAGLAGLMAIALMTGRRSFHVLLVAGLGMVVLAGIMHVPWRRVALMIALCALVSAPLLIGSGLLVTSGDVLRDIMWRAAWAEGCTSWLTGIGASGAVALASGESEPVRWMQAASLWTHHSHNQLLEWFLRGGVCLGALGLAWLGIVAWGIAAIEDLRLRRAAAALWGVIAAGMALDPAFSEPLCTVSLGFAVAFVNWPTAASRAASHWGFSRVLSGCLVAMSLVILTWTCKQCVPSALISPHASNAALARAAGASPDPVTTAHLLAEIRSSFFATPPEDPVFFIAGAESIRGQAGAVGLFWPTLRAAAAVRGDRAVYQEALVNLAHRQPFQPEYHQELNKLFRGSLPYGMPADVRRRCQILSAKMSSEIPIALDGSIDRFADLQACLIAGRTPRAEELKALFCSAGGVPNVITTCYVLAANDPRVDPLWFADPQPNARWAIRQMALPRLGSGAREEALRGFWRLTH